MWCRVWEDIQGAEYTRAKVLLLDSTMVRAQQHATRCPETNGAQTTQALGHSRAELITNMLAGCIDEHTVVALALTSGARNDMPGFNAVVAALPNDQHLEHAVIDRGYDHNQIKKKTLRHTRAWQ